MELTRANDDATIEAMEGAPSRPAGGFYGRAAEERLIEEVLSRVAGGAGEMLLVSGYTGIGKSTLILRQRERVVRSGGRFGYGKFDPGGRNIPYSAVSGAFQSLIEDLLKEEEERRGDWRRRFQEALGPNGRVILRVAPALEALIGAQADLTELGPLENRNRFHLSFQKFVDVFLEDGRPFVVCIDDLQWADLASLSLLKTLITGVGNRPFLLIGAYRDNEVNEKHPLALTVREVELEGVPITRIALGPLDAASLTRLVEETFRCGPDRSAAAARIVREKTGGNPFYVGQFIETGLRNGAIRFASPDGSAGAEEGPGAWEWNMEGLMSQQATDNIAEALKMRAARFAGSERKMLALAACLGSQFDLDTAAAVSGRPRHAVFQDLAPFIQERLLFFVNGRYFFTHDKIQEAAYALIPEREKRQTHCGIGLALWRDAGREEVPNDVFLIADQLNAGGEASIEAVGRPRLIKLNLKAGRLAKDSCAYRSALAYSETAISLLGPDGWREQYAVCLAAHAQAAEAALLSAEFESMDRIIRLGLERAGNLLDQIPFYEILIQSHIARNALRTAVETGTAVLRKLGIRLPRRPTALHVLFHFIKTKLVLRGRGIDELLRLPPMRDGRALAAVRIMVNMGSASYYGFPILLPVIILTIMDAMLRRGNPPTAAFNYTAFGFVLCSIFWDVPTGYAFAARAVELVRTANTRDLAAKCSLLYNVFIRPWREHVRESLPALLEGFAAGLETGDFDYASLCVTMYHSYATYTGLNLFRLEEEERRHIRTVRKIRQRRNINTILKDRLFRLALMGRLADWRTWDHDDCIEKEYVAEFYRANDKINLSSFYLDKAVLAYLLGAYEESLRYSDLAKKHLDLGLGNFVVPEFCFNHGLTLAALHPAKPRLVRWSYSRAIRRHLRRFKMLAAQCPANFANKYAMLQAEWARLRCRTERIIPLYDAAIRESERYEFVNEEGIAHELKAKYLLSQGVAGEGLRHLVLAHRCYERWGALVKTRQLEETYPQLADAVTAEGRMDPSRPDGPAS